MCQASAEKSYRPGTLRTSARQGFTLVELLVVIGIIAVLISILLPSLSRARRAAQAAVCMSNLRQYGIALNLYINENKGIVPYIGGGSLFSSTSILSLYLLPDVAVNGHANPLFCPEEERSAEFYSWASNLSATDPMAVRKADSNYGSNYYMSLYDENASSATNPPQNIRMSSVKVTMIKQSSEVVYMGDITLRTDLFPQYNQQTSEFRAQAMFKPWQLSVLYSGHTMRPLRHSGRDNYLFLDGHAEASDRLSSNYQTYPTRESEGYPKLWFTTWRSMGTYNGTPIPPYQH